GADAVADRLPHHRLSRRLPRARGPGHQHARRRPARSLRPAHGEKGLAMSEPVLDVRDLQTHFRTPAGILRAVDGVSFQVEAGETLAIVGESGCGKSATSMSILRLIPESAGRSAGEIRFGAHDLLQLDEAALRRIRGNEIAMIFQEPMTSLNPVLT